MRLMFRTVALLLIAASVVTCSESPLGLGARAPGQARLAFEPRFSPAALSALNVLSSTGFEVDRARVVVVRPPSDTLKDTTVVFPVGVQALPLELTVAAVPGELLSAGLQYESGSTVLFSGATLVVVRGNGMPGPATPPTVEVAYVGPDLAATQLVITPVGGAFTTTGPVQFTARALEVAGAVVPNVPLAWSTSNAGVATISQAGLLQFTGTDGAVIVTAQTPKGLAATAALTFTSIGPPATITILPTSPTLTALGDLLALAAAVKDQRGTVLTATPTWVSRAPAIVAVTADGLVQAKANGPAYIVASAGAARDSVLVQVRQVVDALLMSRDTVKLALVGDATTLTATAFDRNRNVIPNPGLSFTSSNPLIATVTPAGLVTLVAAGTTNVVAAVGTKSATTVVMQGPAAPVSAALAYIRITPSSGSVRMGSPTQLVAEGVDATGAPMVITPTWGTTQPVRAPISATGLLSPVDTTTVDVTATSKGVVGRATFTVLPAPVVTKFSFAPTSVGGVSLAIAMLTVTVGAADPGNGITSMETVFTGPGGVTRSCAATVPTVGLAARGTWDCILVLPIGSPVGIWHASKVTLVGTVARSFDETQLSAFGTTTLTVTP